MERASLRPTWLMASTLQVSRYSLWGALPLLGVAVIMVVSASALPGAANRPMILGLSAALSWFAALLSAQAVACGYWQLQGGEKLGLGPAFLTVRGLLKPALLSLGLCGLILLLGAAALFVGVIPALAFSLWILCVTSIEGVGGRKAADLAWGRCGPSGIIWSGFSLVAGGLFASYACLALSVFIGSAAVAAWPPLLLLVSVPLTASAYIARR